MNCRFALCICVLFCGLIPAYVARGDDVFKKPVRLRADGKIIDTGPAWGHSSPCIEDIDGDGLKDLILGDFSGKFRIYKNVGNRDEPVYEDAGLIQADGKDASVRIYCCIGSQARFVDLNGDGIRDFISNSYDPGHCYFFRGLPDHKFAAREELVDKAGVPVRSAPQQNKDYQSFGSFFTPVDWDADGDIDILIGCFRDGHLKLRINEGDAKKAVFAAENKTIKAGGQPLKVDRHCCPVTADWDGDGLWDVLAGSDDGSVTWFRNVGTKESPDFEKGVVLVEKHEGLGYDLLLWSKSEFTPGIRSQIEVIDYNGDGKLDLLLGDFLTAYAPRVDLDGEERKKLQKMTTEILTAVKQYRKKRKALQEESNKKYPGDAGYSDEAEKWWSKAYKALRESPEVKEMDKRNKDLARKIRPFLAKTHSDGDESDDLAIPHGYVWLFIRK